jgi:hypothetical protein
MADVRRAWESIASEVADVTIRGRAAWMLQTHMHRIEEPPARERWVRLLPAFDTYLLGYKNRDLLVPPEHARRVNAGGGIVHPVLLVDRAVTGTWRIRRRSNQVEVIVDPFERLPARLDAALRAEVADIGRFLGRNRPVAP